MDGTGELLEKVTHLKQLYERYIYRDKDEIGLKPLEIDLLLFLHNYREKNTARDFCRLCRVPKSNASNGIRMLERKGLLRITTDEEDRKIHRLHITEKAEPIAEQITEHHNDFTKEVLNIFIQKEKRLILEMVERLDIHVANLLKQKTEMDEIEIGE